MSREAFGPEMTGWARVQRGSGFLRFRSSGFSGIPIPRISGSTAPCGCPNNGWYVCWRQEYKVDGQLDPLVPIVSIVVPFLVKPVL